MNTKVLFVLLIIAASLFWVYLILSLIVEHDKRIRAEVDRDLWKKDTQRYKQELKDLRESISHPIDLIVEEHSVKPFNLKVGFSVRSSTFNDVGKLREHILQEFGLSIATQLIDDPHLTTITINPDPINPCDRNIIVGVKILPDPYSDTNALYELNHNKGI